jgi:drug/metabolite transporter (DMT)-like permease
MSDPRQKTGAIEAASRVAVIDRLFSEMPRPAMAILLMVASGFFGSFMQVGVRFVPSEIPTVEIVFLRAFFTCVLTLPFVLQMGRQSAAWRTNAPGLQICRGVLSVLALSLWYYAIAHMPFAEAAALGFTTAIFLVVGAAIVFRETVGPVRWGAAAVGFLGALIIMRPGSGPLNWLAISVLGSSLMWAVSMLLAKQLAKYDSTLTNTFYQPLTTAPLALLAAAPLWVWPDFQTLLLFAGMGGLAGLANSCMIHALRIADASLSAPAEYVRLIWMSLWGYLIFAEVPVWTTWLGAILIIAATAFMTWHETRGRKS